MRYIICSLNSELIGKIYIFNNNSPFNTNYYKSNEIINNEVIKLL